ncbi:MAG: hypothetical protein ACOX61_12970 [Brooklawnia sp.]
MATAHYNPEIDAQQPPYEGGQWPFFMSGQSLEPVVGDNLTELVGLLPGMPDDYSRLDPEQAALARIEMATTVAENWQEWVAAHLYLAGAWDHDEEPEPIVQAILGGRTDPVIVDEWTHPVPLVLVAAQYAPYTDVALPVGNVMVLDPRNDRTLLETFAEAGIIEFRAHRSWLRSGAWLGTSNVWGYPAATTHHIAF